MNHPCTITATIAPCRFGYFLVAATAHGVCAVTLGDDPDMLQDDLERRFGTAIIRHTGHVSNNLTDTIHSYLNGVQKRLDLPLDVMATPFQRLVWRRCAPFHMAQHRPIRRWRNNWDVRMQCAPWREHAPATRWR